MLPLIKKAAKPKDVPLESNLPDELPKFALPNGENKLFDEGDDVWLSTIHDLSTSNEEAEEEKSHQPKFGTMWVQHQGMNIVEQSDEWDERYLAKGELSTSNLDTPWGKKSLEVLKTNPIKNLLMLWKYLHDLVGEA